MAHPDRGAGKGSLTLRERQALRRGDKVYRNGISVDRDGRPIAGDLDEQGQDRSQWGISGSNIDSQGNAIDPTSPDYAPTTSTILTQSGDDWGMEDLDDYYFLGFKSASEKSYLKNHI